MCPKHAEVLSKMESAEVALKAVQREIANMESHGKKLQLQLADIFEQNHLIVLPELERLNKLLSLSNQEVSVIKRACGNDEQRIVELSSLIEMYQKEVDDIQSLINERNAALNDLPEGETSTKDIAMIESSAKAIKAETEDIDERKKKVITQTGLQLQRRDDLKRQRSIDQKQLDLELVELEKKHRGFDDCAKALGEERVKQHSLASLRVEIEINVRAELEGIMHNSNFATADIRQVNAAKSCLAKKTQVTSKVKESLAQMEAKISVLHCRLSAIQSEKSSLEEEKSDLRSKLDSSLIKFLEYEDIDETLQKQLDDTMKLVSERECEVEQWRVEERKASTILSVMNEKRKILQRKIEQAHQINTDIQDAIRLQQLIEIDISNKMQDATAKMKEFSSLREMIESEKLETTMLIQTTNQALADMKRKCGDLQIQLRTLTSESDTKMDTLRLLRRDIDTSCQTRASDRRDKSHYWSTCRATLAEISKEEARMEQLKATLCFALKQVERVELQNSQTKYTKRSLADHLPAKRDQLVSVFNSINVYSQTLKKGELMCKQLEDEKKIADLKSIDIKRSNDVVKSKLQDQAEIKDKTETAKKQLELHTLETGQISNALESPNKERIRTLQGHDPSEEELRQNTSILESLESKNRMILLKKATALKEIMTRCKQLQDESNNWKESTKLYVKDVNDYQGRLHDLQRVHTAQLSELQMYTSLVEKLNTSKLELHLDLSPNGQFARNQERKLLVFRAHAKKQVVELRPTAYIPQGDEDEIIKVPRPFGRMAPFLPTEPGSTMRHIRKPQPISFFPQK
ncbi:hypothetical protein HJC23_006467 [Cyclotella cryptica]|uniref:Uncharacterized protein n=1 Tax=Cyclotella cryptica TaxID=29204 RepID=A0ABD3QWB2_9STRA